MLVAMIKKAREQKQKREEVLNELHRTCQRIVIKTGSLKQKLSNGGGEAIIQGITGNSHVS